MVDTTKAVGTSDSEDTVNRNLTKNVRKKKSSSFSRGAKANMETGAYKNCYLK